jgi:hypothetical protein
VIHSSYQRSWKEADFACKNKLCDITKCIKCNMSAVLSPLPRTKLMKSLQKSSFWLPGKQIYRLDDEKIQVILHECETSGKTQQSCLTTESHFSGTYSLYSSTNFLNKNDEKEKIQLTKFVESLH